MIKNKKAISQTITTVFLILIGISSVSIVSFLIFSLISNPSLSPENNCLESSIEPIIKINSACYNSSSKSLNLILTRSLNSKNMNDFEINLIESSETTKWSCGSSCSSCLLMKEGESKTYALPKEVFGDIEDSQIVIYSNKCLLGSRKLTNC